MLARVLRRARAAPGYQALHVRPGNRDDEIAGQLGDGTTVKRLTPVPINNLFGVVAVLLWRGTRIALHAPDRFGFLVASGVTSLLLINALINAVGGATWVSFHHGGGVGIGYSQHAGQVIVADGTPEAAVRLERVLTTDPGMGVVTHTAPIGEFGGRYSFRDGGVLAG